MMDTKKDFIKIIDLDTPHVDVSNSVDASVGVNNVNDKAGKSDYFKLESIDEYISRKDSEESNEIIQESDQPTAKDTVSDDYLEKECDSTNSKLLEGNSHVSPTSNDHTDIETVILNAGGKENSIPVDLTAIRNAQRLKKKKGVKKSKQTQR